MMTLRRNLIIVETPLQLVCGYEAWSMCDGKADFIIRLTGRGKNDEHLIKSAGLLNIKYTTIRLRPNHFALDLVLNIKKLLSIKKKYDAIFLGSFNSRGMRFLVRFFIKKSIWFMDDGASTCLIQDKISKKNSSPNFFTFFDVNALPDGKVIQHNFSNVTKLFDIKGVGGSFFIGQPVFRMRNLGVEKYIQCINRSVELSDQNKVIYIPHRVEDLETLERITRIPGVVILSLEECVELYFLKIGLGPKQIFSFYSTGLFTLPLMFPACCATAFRPSSHKDKDKDKDKEIIYNAFEKYRNVKILNC